MASPKLKKGPFAVLAVILLGGFGLRYAYNNGYLGPSSGGPAVVPQVAALPQDTAAPAPVQTAVPVLPLPSTAPAAVSGPQVRFLGMAWQAQLALAEANGGPQTTQGSLMEKHGVNLSFVREDDCGKMQTQLVAFAKSLHDGNPQPTEGANFVCVMGDGSAAFIAGMWDELSKLGPEYVPEAFGSPGFSRGEDALWGPAAWKQNPKLMRGSLISGYLRDGDWNIALKYAADNGIKNNPDEKTYDPDAINWYAANDFI
jgi:OmpA-OmpF porin, OOP family